MKNFEIHFEIKKRKCTYSCTWINENARGCGANTYDFKCNGETRRIIFGSSCFPECTLSDGGEIHFYLQGTKRERDEKRDTITENEFNKAFPYILKAMDAFDKSLSKSRTGGKKTDSYVDYNGEKYPLDDTTIPLLLVLFGRVERV